MRRSGLKNLKEIIWYVWVIGGALISVNAIVTYILGHESVLNF